MTQHRPLTGLVATVTPAGVDWRGKPHEPREVIVYTHDRRIARKRLLETYGPDVAYDGWRREPMGAKCKLVTDHGPPKPNAGQG